MIISIVRRTFGEENAPNTFTVGTSPVEGSPTVSKITYQTHGSSALRRPYYKVEFADSTVFRIVPEDTVIDIAVQVAEKKKGQDAPEIPEE